MLEQVRGVVVAVVPAAFRAGGGVFAVAAPDCDAPTLEELVEHLRDQEIASYKLPERLEYLDALPRNPVGKVVKPDLRARWSVPEDPVTSATTNPEGDLS